MRQILVLNAGSSSLKASVIDGEAERPLAHTATDLQSGAEARVAVRQVLEAIATAGVDAASLEAVGHRIVHGGAEFTRTTRIDDAMLDRLRPLAPLAPLHNPVATEVIGAAREALPNIAQFAAFDTAFHATLAPEAYVYALPYEWHAEWGYRRYGFHGLSVNWAVERTAALLARDATELGVVVAHLGAGCSVTAVWRGRSVATSMGMTPLEGLVMGTRAGSVDPGILVAAQRDHGLDPASLGDILDRRAGLLGISGRSADMRELLSAAPSDERAALAIEIFERSAAAGIAAAATALPRLDAIAFTGGIGEHAGSVRGGIVRRLASIGVRQIGREGPEDDSVLARSPVAVLRITAREDVVIAREIRRLVEVAEERR